MWIGTKYPRPVSSSRDPAAEQEARTGVGNRRKGSHEPQLPDSSPSLDETLDGSTKPITCRDRFRVLILDVHLPDFKCHLGLSLRGNNSNDRGGALQTPGREQRMSRQIYHDANNLIKSQDTGDLRRIKSHKDSGSADVDYGPRKFHSPPRDGAHAAAQPQAETASAPPVN